jgi:hypothetical protein
MLGILIGYPWLALLPAVIFVIVYWRSKLRLMVITSTAWFLYTIYEYGMYLRILCSGECNIRIDLLLIYPFLVILSITAIIKGILAINRKQKIEKNG